MVAPERRSRVYGLFYTIGIGTGALAPPLFGLLSDASGYPVMLAVLAAVILVTLPLAHLLRPAAPGKTRPQFVAPRSFPPVPSAGLRHGVSGVISGSEAPLFTPKTTVVCTGFAVRAVHRRSMPPPSCNSFSTLKYGKEDLQRNEKSGTSSLGVRRDAATSLSYRLSTRAPIQNPVRSSLSGRPEMPPWKGRGTGISFPSASR